MKTNTLVIAATCAALLSSCAATVPIELVNAREAHSRAANGPAAQIAPAELHVASQALALAEQSFQNDEDSYRTRDLAYVAGRKSELATAKASIAVQQTKENQSKSDYSVAQGKIVKDTKEDLTQARTALTAAQQTGTATSVALAASERSGKLSAEQLAAEQVARAAAEKKATEAQIALAKLGSVKEEPRGTVITLSGSVLFASNQAVLLPQARTRLDQVAEVLLTTRERNITIEGHTDSQGTDANNQSLSQRRADAVRDYIVAKGYGSDLVKSNGLGEGHPVADNSGPEGRANNRRVEIIIARDAHASR